jgi:hypothetical protein
MLNIKKYIIMKIPATVLFLLFVALLFTACNNEEGSVSTDLVQNPITASGEDHLDQLPEFEFKETLHDFGTVIEGEKVMYTFVFKNVGKTDLLVSGVSASCGCTATKFTKDAIPPGEEGTITVTFDSRKRRGFQNKSVTVSANTQPNKTVLRIKAKVVSPSDL